MENSINPYHHISKTQSLVSTCLKDHFQVNPEQIALLLKLGAIYIGKNRVYEDCEIKKDDHLRFYPQPRRYAVDQISWKERIIRDTRDYLIINKPAGIPTIATTDNGLENVLEQMRRAQDPSLLVTHRLDTPTSGLLVLAKTKDFQARYNQWLVEGNVEKYYIGITEEKLPPGLITHFMDPTDSLPRRVATEPRKGWLKCALEIRNTEAFTAHGIDYFRLEIRLLTGRTHQIRAQLAALSAPIVGDREYGFKGKAPIVEKKAIALQAFKLSFPGENAELPRI